MSKKVECYRDSKRFTASTSEITATRLASAFQVDVDTLYLKEEWGDLALWPTDSGRFNFTNVDGSSFEVMGEAISNGATGFSYTPSPTFTGNTSQAIKKPLALRKTTSTSTFACKIILASDMAKNGKAATFTEEGQTFIQLNDDTANVNFIKEQMEGKVGKKVLIVAGNGLPIEDENGTRGTKFWKCPSRKIYAIPQPADITKRKKKSTFSDTSSESEGESVTSAHKKRRSSRHEKTLESITDEMKSLRQQLHEVSKSVEEISKAIKEITSISKSMTIPLSLGKLLRDTFRCTICLKQPMHPPIVVAKCCNILLGCATCVNQWYGGSDGLDKGCPHCREPRGYASTGQFKGLDEFLQAIQNIFDGGESEDSGSQDD